MIVFITCHCTANGELDLANTFLLVLVYWPPPNSVTLHIHTIHFMYVNGVKRRVISVDDMAAEHIQDYH